MLKKIIKNILALVGAGYLISLIFSIIGFKNIVPDIKITEKDFEKNGDDDEMWVEEPLIIKK